MRDNIEFAGAQREFWADQKLRGVKLHVRFIAERIRILAVAEFSGDIEQQGDVFAQVELGVELRTVEAVSRRSKEAGLRAEVEVGV